MNNEKFSALVKEQKQKKLISALRYKSRRFLNDMEIESIARLMDVDRQYSVNVYIDSVNFDPSCIPERQSGEFIYLCGREFEPTVFISHSNMASNRNSVVIVIPPCRMTTTLQGSWKHERKELS